LHLESISIRRPRKLLKILKNFLMSTIRLRPIVITKTVTIKAFKMPEINHRAVKPIFKMTNNLLRHIALIIGFFITNPRMNFKRIGQNSLKR
jgi:hypothetical protein